MFAYAGTYARYWADDYCYSATIKQHGLAGGIVDWYRVSGNRVSTLVPVALSELFGPAAIQFLPLSILILWAGACVYFLFQLKRITGWKIHPAWIILLSLAHVYFAILLAPDRLQAFYWRMGTLHYTLPVPILLILLGLLLGYWQRGKRQISLEILYGLIAFAAAGLSETYAALQTGLFITVLAFVFLVMPESQRLKAARLLGIPLAGSLLMMLVMVLSPSNAWRQAALPPPDNLLEIIPVSLRHAGDFIFYSIRGKPVPFFVYCLIVTAVALLGFQHKDRPVPARRSLLGLILSLVVMFGLIVCSFAPSSYAGLQYPAGRAQMPAHFVLLAGLGAACYWVARAVGRTYLLQRFIGLRLAVLLALTAACFYPLRAVSTIQADLTQLSIRAERWDARSGDIQQAAATGVRDIEVKQVDVVAGLEDIGPDPNFWINRCAAVYYGVNSITASPLTTD